MKRFDQTSKRTNKETIKQTFTEEQNLIDPTALSVSEYNKQVYKETERQAMGTYVSMIKDNAYRKNTSSLLNGSLQLGWVDDS